MKTARKKLNSQRGASLMLALLLFLICAVLGSVVLMAGTAAAGRFSELSKMEQRYYAVSSAANLLREKLCDENGATVKGVQTKKTARTISYGTDGTISISDPSVLSEEYTWPASTAGDPLADKLARYAVLGNPNSSDDTYKWNNCSGTGTLSGDVTLPSIVLTVQREGAEEAGLTVDVRAKLRADGTMLLELSNRSGSDQYTLKMTLTPMMDRSQSRTESTEVITGSGENTEITTTELTQTVRVHWVVSAIQTEEGTREGGSGG